MNDLRETQLAWIAGFLDGEGSFSVHVSQNKRDAGKPSALKLYTYISVTQSEPRHIILHEMAAETGVGTVHCKGVARLNCEYREAWGWVVRGPNAIDLCRALLPFLRLKRRHAEVMIAVHETKLGSHIGARRGGKSIDLRVPDEVIRERVRLVREICALNRRGTREKVGMKALRLAEENLAKRLERQDEQGSREP